VTPILPGDYHTADCYPPTAPAALTQLHTLPPTPPNQTKPNQTKPNPQVLDSINWNGLNSNYSWIPPEGAPHGSHAYIPTRQVNSWWWGNNTYNDTWDTVMVAAASNVPITMQAVPCNRAVCNGAPPGPTGNSTWKRWSDLETWMGVKPKAGRWCQNSAACCLCAHALAGWVSSPRLVGGP
jgi:hypothetical protein